MMQRDRCARHFERRAVIADPGRVRLHADIGKTGGHPPVHDVEFHQRRRPERVDQHRHLVAPRWRHFGEDSVEHLVDDLIRRLKLSALYARLAVDSHADLHLVRPDVEVGTQGLRQGARPQRHAHCIGMIVRLAGHALALVEGQHAVTGCTGGLKDEEIAGNPAAFLLQVARR
jgi:hypothetical protein